MSISLSRRTVSCLRHEFAAGAQETADTDERNSGPKNLVITYRCPPAKRPALRQYMLREGASRFDKWEREGSSVITAFCSLATTMRRPTT